MQTTQNQSFDRELVLAKARQMRHDIIVQTHAAGSGHPGGSLSASDIVATLYFGGILNLDPAHLGDPLRNRFLLSKGHAAPVLYAALCELGVFERDELETLRALGSRLQGHPDTLKLPGVEASTGSLGQGLSIATGMALGLRASYGKKAPHVFTLLGDGELQEGQNWEAAMFAAHQKVGNLVAIVDHNNLQIDGFCDDVVALGDVAAKFVSFGWHSLEVDGHDVDALYQAITQAQAYIDGPAVVVAHTTKGKGVSFMENQCSWHGTAPNAEQMTQALDEILQ